LYQAKHLNAIADNFNDLNGIAVAIRDAGLEKSQLIFGEDLFILLSLNKMINFEIQELTLQSAIWRMARKRFTEEICIIMMLILEIHIKKYSFYKIV
jgi:hypothetical protein